MTLGLKVLCGLYAALMAGMGLRWWLAFDGIAAEWFVKPLSDLGINNLTADMGSLFLGSAIMIAMGLRSGQSVWLLATALILQGVGVHRRFAASEELAETRRALQEMSVQLVATNRYFLPSMLASMTPEVVFLDIVGDEEVQALIPKAIALGIERIALVSTPGRTLRLPPVMSGMRIVTTPGPEGRTLIELKRE